MAEHELITEKKAQKKDLFNSKPVIFLVSLFCSLAIWCVVSMYETPETDRVFQDVKVQMNLTDTVPGLLNMSVFGTNEFYCDVTVNGKSYLVNDTTFTSDKIIVKPKLEEVRSPGVYEVELVAQLVNSSAELAVVSVEPQFITVYFDTLTEKSYSLSLVGAEEYTVAEDCLVESMTLRPSSVTVSGPSLEMETLKEIKAIVAFDEPISRTTQYSVDIEFVSEGKNINYAQIAEIDELHLDVQVSVEKTYRMEVDFVNAPEGLDLDALIDYNFVDYNNELTLYVPTESETLMTSQVITVGRINMSAIGYKSYQTLSAERYNRNIFYEVLPGMLDVAVTLNTDQLKQITVTVPLQTDELDISGYSFPENIESVTIIADANADDLSFDGIYAVPDVAAIKRVTDSEGSVPVQIVLPADCDYAWVSGRYSVQVVNNNLTSEE